MKARGNCWGKTGAGSAIPGSVLLLQSGCTTVAAGVGIGAIGGGIEPQTADAGDYGLDEPWKWVSARACGKLKRAQPFDVLLSHVSPCNRGRDGLEYGSRRLREVVEACQPSYHFFAHHRGPISPMEIGATKCFWLNDVKFDKKHKGMNPHGAVHDRCMGILEWQDPSHHSFEYVGDPSIRALSWSSWLYA